MLERFSERYQPTGGLAAEGVLNQLGRPSIEPLEVLVREAVQNCWDARRPDVSTVRVDIGYRSLDAAGSRFLRENVLPDVPPSLPLSDCLARDVALLYFADFGTTGLGGPTRADVQADGTTDFVDFVRNIGQPPDKALGGGSFGYGKAAFYLASRANTIIIDTLAAPDQARRLIAYALGDHHRAEGVPYTGRHWWGIIEDGVPEPATGAAAKGLAARLGLPAREGEDGLGTTVAIVSPRLGAAVRDDEELPLADMLPFIGECLAWNFWPKMIGSRGIPSEMQFRLLYGDAVIPVPDPRVHDRLAPFSEAMDILRDEDGTMGDPFGMRRDLFSLRPQRKVGTIAIHHTPTSRREELSGPQTRGAREMTDGVHHVALMRNAELVVRYEAGAAPLVPGRGYAGVFRCDLLLDEVFRRSEPPTHDTWQPTTLHEPTEKRLVNAALRRVREVLDEIAGPKSTEEGGAETVAVSVGRFADQLAMLMPSVVGPGARRAPLGLPGGGGPGLGAASSQGTTGQSGGETASAGSTNGSGEAPTRSPAVLSLDVPELHLGDNGETTIRTRFRLATAGQATRLAARVEVLTMDGGQIENEPPLGTKTPGVLRWTAPGGSIRTGDAIEVEPSESGEWMVWVAHNADLMVRVVIDVVEAG